MKINVPDSKEIEIKYVRVLLPVNFGEEHIPNDFPHRKGDEWEAVIDIDTGVILDWPEDPRFQKCNLSMKVCDEGLYYLLKQDRTIAAVISDDYVPHGVIPGKYGDYVNLNIEHGRITNWPTHPDATEFFRS